MKKICKILVLSCMLTAFLTGCSDDADDWDDWEDGEFSEIEMERTGDMEEDDIEELVDEDAKWTFHRGVSVEFMPGTMMDGTPLTEEFYVYRSSLTPGQQAAYDVIRAGCLEAKEQIDITVPLEKDDLRPIVNAVYGDGPDIFWLTRGYSYLVNGDNQIVYIRPKYTQEFVDMGIENAAQTVYNAAYPALAEAARLERQVDKEKYLHDYVSHIVEYAHASHDQTPYGGLIDGQCVCGGYSRTYQYLMQKAGVPCVYIRNQGHAWDLVKLDGEYYNVDVCWDDVSDPPRYTYFNMPHDAFTATPSHHRDDWASMLPVPAGTEYYYENVFSNEDAGSDFSGLGDEQPEEVPEETTDGDGGHSEEGDNSEDGGETADDSTEGEQEENWWSLLDENWTKDSWTVVRSGLYKIPDEGTVYYHEESTDTFYAIDPDGSSYRLGEEAWEDSDWSPDGGSASAEGDEDSSEGEDGAPEGDDSSSEEETENWWNFLDESWTRESWAAAESGGLWVHYDQESDIYYYWNENTDEYFCQEEDVYYFLNTDTGEWIETDSLG